MPEIKEMDVSDLGCPLEGIRRITLDEGLDDLSQNIKIHGLMEPLIIIQYDNDEKYTIISGCRRFHAIKNLGWKKVLCLIISKTDSYRGNSSKL